MAAADDDRDGVDAVEALRRALYRPGVGPEDLAAYRLRADAGSKEAPAAEPRASRRGPSRRGVAIAGGAAAVAAVGAALLVPRRPGPAPAKPGLLPLSADDRGELAHNLARGRSAGLRTVLLSRPYPAALSRLGELAVTEWTGRGARMLALPAIPQQDRVGRITVLAVLGADGVIGWTLRRGDSPGRSAERRQPAGAVSALTLRVTAAARPDGLVVTGPAGVPWGAAVILTDPTR